ncbi:hypothetical protein [Streptomyces parvulus]|uniref:hypothetical protein n=1 Tax=Streptomyces parvulus TaxID=146923 RepID=UPI00342F15FD
MEEVVAPVEVVALNDVGKVGFVKVFAKTKPLARDALTCAFPSAVGPAEQGGFKRSPRSP